MTSFAARLIPRISAAVIVMTTSLSLIFSARADEPRRAFADGTRIANADSDGANWLTYGRTYSEQRYSPLSRINAENAKNLALAWYADLDTNRGQEATPLVIDGVVSGTTR